MKEVKFRGATLGMGSTVYGSLIQEKGADGKTICIIRTEEGEEYCVSNSSVSQFVGYDDNGEEVYLDDVTLNLNIYKKAFEDAIADIIRTQNIYDKCPACFFSRICNDDVDFAKCFEKLKSAYLKDAEKDLSEEVI